MHIITYKLIAIYVSEPPLPTMWLLYMIFVFVFSGSLLNMWYGSKKNFINRMITISLHINATCGICMPSWLLLCLSNDALIILLQSDCIYKLLLQMNVMSSFSYNLHL